MFTSDGLNWLAVIVEERLAGAQLQVGNGETAVAVPIESIEVAEDGTVKLVGTFGEEQANFDWRSRSILLADGTEIDRVEEDQGRKAQGSVWTLEAEVEFGA